MTHETTEHRYSYKPGWMPIIGGGLFFGACAAVLCNVAMTNEKGLVLNGIITLSLASATVFYWSLTLASLLFVLGAVAMAWLRINTSHEIKLTHDALVAPRSLWTSQYSSIPFSEIDELIEQNISGQRLLSIVPKSQKKLTIAGSHLPSKHDFEEFQRILAERVNLAKN